VAPIIRICSLTLGLLAAPAVAATPADLSAYVRARAADAGGAPAAAVAGYAAALDAAPKDAVVAIRAYRAALRLGDLPLADRARAVLEAAGVAPGDAALLALAEAARAGDKPAALAAIKRLSGGPLAFLGPPLTAWAAYPDSSPALTSLAADALDRRYGLDAGALIALARGQRAAGLAVLRAQLGEEGALDLRLAAARLLAAQGDRAGALEVLQGDEPTLAAARRLIDRPVRPGLAFGLARALSRLAEDLENAHAGPLGIAVARALLIVEPENDAARLLLAQSLATDGAPDLGLAALDQVAPASPQAAAARTARVDLLAAAGRQAEALAAAQKLAAAPGAAPREAQRLGDLLAAAGREREAAAAYGRAIERAGADAGWGLYLQQGGALDRAGDWAAAEPLLMRAVELAPDEPVALNYLAYARLEHGGDVAAARALLERAAKLKPNDASIQDSLAWAYYLSGDPMRALPLLERAAIGEPANGTISEHLGDVYWALGRRFEARYAWTAAAQLAENADAARIAAKLDRGPAK